MKASKRSTFVLEAAHHTGRGCSCVVPGEAPVQLQHVLRGLPAGSEGPPIREVHGGQKVAEEVAGVKQRIISGGPARADGAACAHARQRQQQRDVQPEDGADGKAHGGVERWTRRCVGDLRPSDGGLSFGAGQLAAVGGNEKSAFAPVDLLVWLRGQGCCVLTCLEMSLWPPLALLSLSTHQERQNRPICHEVFSSVRPSIKPSTVIPITTRDLLNRLMSGSHPP